MQLGAASSPRLTQGRHGGGRRSGLFLNREEMDGHGGEGNTAASHSPIPDVKIKIEASFP